MCGAGAGRCLEGGAQMQAQVHMCPGAQVSEVARDIILAGGSAKSQRTDQFRDVEPQSIFCSTQPPRLPALRLPPDAPDELFTAHRRLVRARLHCFRRLPHWFECRLSTMCSFLAIAATFLEQPIS